MSSVSALPPDVVLRVSGVSKKFCRNLKRSMWYGIQDLSKNLLGFRSNPETADRRLQTADFSRGSASGSEDAEQGLQSAVCGLQSEHSLRPSEFWALRNVSFDLKRGERLGLIGENGCGKTTLLRIITGIFPPDHGEIAIRGRVGALIALGAGFHPHMTGRENVYLNAAILGMHRSEIDEKLEDIIRFAEVSDFIDAPVSTYSSGMRVRLGFSVAAFTEPDVMLVDEVLAVGDMAFRAKCAAKIGEMCDRGLTVVFVAHDMAAVQSLCHRVLWLDKGLPLMDGSAANVIGEYMNAMDAMTVVRGREEQKRLGRGTGHIEIEKVVIKNRNGIETDCIEPYEPLTLEIHYNASQKIEAPYFWIGFKSAHGSISAANMLFDGHRPPFVEGTGILSCHFGPLPFCPQVYRVFAGIRAADGVTMYIETRQVALFRVESDMQKLGHKGDLALALARLSSPVLLPYIWEFEDGRRVEVDPERNASTS